MNGEMFSSVEGTSGLSEWVASGFIAPRSLYFLALGPSLCGENAGPGVPVGRARVSEAFGGIVGGADCTKVRMHMAPAAR